MRFVQVLLVQVFLHGLLQSLALAQAPPIADESPARLGKNVTPVFQAIHLSTDPSQSGYDGSVRIELQVREATRSFRFHSRGHELQRVALRRAEGEVPVEYERLGEDLVIVRSERELAAGRYDLEVDFKAEYSTRISGLFRTEDDAGAYLHTIFQPIDARRAFPCWDEPSFKIPFQVTLTLPEDLMAVSNTSEEKRATANGLQTVVFRKTPPMPTYDVAIAVGPFETVPIKGLSVPGRIVTAPGRSRLAGTAAAMTPRVLEALETYFDSPHPYEKLDLLAAVGFPEGAFEAPGAVLFGESLLLVDPETAPISQHQSLLEHLAHEVAHMWFGNYVTLAWWDDIWLNESFATWMGSKIAHQIDPELGIDSRSLSTVHRALHLDAQAGTAPIRRDFADAQEAFTVSSLVTYFKGSRVLSMFERWIGPEPFRKAVNDYLKEYAWGNATSEEFLAALDKSTGRNLSPAFKTFIDQPGFPLVEVEFRDGRVYLSQERFLNYGSAPALKPTWKIPVTLKFDDGEGVRTETFLLEEPRQSFEWTAAPQWILPNADAGAYYRWSLPPKRLRALVGEELTPLEKLDLIANAGALLSSGHLGGGGYLELLHAATENELAGDPDPAVLSALVTAFDTVATNFITDETEQAYASFLRQTLGPALELLGLEARAGEAGPVASIRGRLYLLLGETGRDRDVRRHARRMSEDFFEGRSVAPELLGASLKLAALDGGPELFEHYAESLARAEPMARGKIVQGMAHFPEEELRTRPLDEFLAGKLGLNEFFAVAFTLGRGDSAVVVFRWIRDHYEALSSKLPPFAMPYLADIAGGECSVEHLEKVESFFEDPRHRVDATAAQLAQVGEKVRGCADLRRREGEAVLRALARLDSL